MQHSTVDFCGQQTHVIGQVLNLVAQDNDGLAQSPAVASWRIHYLLRQEGVPDYCGLGSWTGIL
eukprot:6330293-Karenia_brevis.AAC.1